MAARNDETSLRVPIENVAGLLTKTVVHSPVVHWILPARIRSKDYNDVAFVGDDFVHIKQLTEHYHLDVVASDYAFDARIRAAKVFSIRREEPNEDLFIKDEFGRDDAADRDDPSQLLVLSLDSNELLFLYLESDGFGSYRFVHQSCPVPTFDRVLSQPGEYLAISPRSDALAVAAHETELVIYAAKSKEQITHELRSCALRWSPIAEQRSLQVEGIIKHMDFLIPSVADEEHTMLLLIVAERQRLKAIWIDWHQGVGLFEAQIHAAHPLDLGQGLSSLLIPLKNAAFLLARGSQVTRFDDIVSGSATSKDVPLPVLEPIVAGASPRRPLWTAWCRPSRSTRAFADTDHIYLAREDGSLCLIEAAVEVSSSHAGELLCHVGCAFASLGDSTGPDILAVAGDMSTGQIIAIGDRYTPVTIQSLSFMDEMEVDIVETIANWATATDMVTSTLSGKSARPRPALFVTSGRQPYGTVTELRTGLEARLSIYFELEGLRTVSNVWALPLVGNGNILLILSSPSGSRLLYVSADADMQNIEEVDEDIIALDTALQTLAASVLPNGDLVQITADGLRCARGMSSNYSNNVRVACHDDKIVVAAAISAELGLAVIVERSVAANSKYMLVRVHLCNDDNNAAADGARKPVFQSELSAEPSCISLAGDRDSPVCLVTDVSGNITIYELGEGALSVSCTSFELLPDSDGPALCDSMVILDPPQSNKGLESESLLVCGLRNGRLHALSISLGNRRFGKAYSVNFSQTAVKLTQSFDQKSTAYATSGIDLCLLSWNGADVESLKVESIWISDKLRPDLAQESVSACTHMPAAHLLYTPDLAGSLGLISGDEFMVVDLDRQVHPVPRHMPVSGMPNRLIYAEQQRSLVCASLRYDVRSFSSELPHSKPEEKRQIWPVIDFIPARGSTPSFTYDMQPGERVYALLEWSHRPSEDKVYSYILVGGSYIKSSGSVRGRITFLQPTNKSWVVVDVHEGRKTNFDAPVYALALYDDTTYIACIGHTVVAYRFSVEDRKWKAICRPHQLTSPGVHLSVSASFVYISTAEDSLVKLELMERPWRQETSWRIVASSPRADSSISHLTFTSQDPLQTTESSLTLTSTKTGKILGLRHSQGDGSGQPNVNELVFEATLPRSLTRIRKCSTRPPWKAAPPSSVLFTDIIGTAADGTLVGVALLDKHAWRRLSWLQRLCEWSEELSPYSFQEPLYRISERGFARDERAMPLGLSGSSEGQMLMRTSRRKEADGHIDGDVIARLLEKGGAEMLKKIIRLVAERNDRAGEWMRTHLNEELEAVDEVVDLIEGVLDCWM